MSHIVQRLAQSLVSLAILFLFVFVAIRVVPGDPARLMAGISASDAQVDGIRAALGLDLPIWQQYLRFVLDLLRGDLGTSIVNNRPVAGQILEGFSYTVPLVAAGMGLAVLIGVPAGVVAALKHNHPIDLLVTSAAVATTSLPAFWLALILIDWLAVGLRLLPSAGTGTWRHFVLPAAVLASTQIGLIARLMRGSVIDVMSADHVRTARGKGLPGLAILLRHVLLNAAAPTVTVIGLQTGLVLGGAVVTETIFNWPGVGRLLIQSVLYRDYPMIQGLIILFGVSFVAINIVVDLTNMALDPRLRAR